MPNPAKSLVDANVLLRLLLQDQPVQLHRAQDILQESPPASLVVAAVTLAEVIYILRGMKFDRAPSVQALQHLMGYEQFVYDESTLSACLDLYATTTLDLADCYLITRSLRRGEGLTTQDGPMQKVYERLRKQAS